MNAYATLSQYKDRINVVSTAHDAALLMQLEAASAQVDAAAGRRFCTRTETRYFEAASKDLVIVDDLLSVTSLAQDDDIDDTFAETWVENTDFVLAPEHEYPKTRIERLKNSDYSFVTGVKRMVKIVGVFGFGDGQTSGPWSVTGITGTVATAAGTTLTLSAEGTLVVGHTIKLESEQMYVTAVSTGGTKTATVQRGVNGTTAAAHTTAAISTAMYPPQVTDAAIWLAAMLRNATESAGWSNYSLGDFSAALAQTVSIEATKRRLLGGLIRR